MSAEIPGQISNRDWRIGCSCKPKYRHDPLYYERGKIIDVLLSGTGGLDAKHGILQIRMDDTDQVILRRADEWVTA